MTQSESHDPSAQLGYRHFADRVGTIFPVEAGEIRELELVGVEKLPHSPRPGGGFRLEFAGPPAPILPQAIYIFPIEGGPREIFIVPLGPAPDGRLRYEAVFF